MIGRRERTKAANRGALVDAARDAFIQGLRLTAVISVVGALALAIFAALTLRGVRRGSGGAGAPVEEAVAEPAIASTT